MEGCSGIIMFVKHFGPGLKKGYINALIIIIIICNEPFPDTDSSDFQQQ